MRPATTRILERRKREMRVGELRPWDITGDPLGRAPLRPFSDVREFIERTSDVVAHVDPATRLLTLSARANANAELAVAAGPMLWMVSDRGISRHRIGDGRLIGERFEYETNPTTATVYAGALWTDTLRGDLIKVDP